jgi:ribonuclease HI
MNECCISTIKLLIAKFKALKSEYPEFDVVLNSYNKGIQNCIVIAERLLPKQNNYKIYADGACSGNPGPGGWGYVTVQNDQNIGENHGNQPATTNNQMELSSAIYALDWLYSYGREGDVAEIVMDSQYVIKGITKWINTWKKNNWKNSSKKPVKNDFLWKKLDQLLILLKENSIELKWIWTQGHSDDKWNIYADSLATGAIFK